MRSPILISLLCTAAVSGDYCAGVCALLPSCKESYCKRRSGKPDGVCQGILAGLDGQPCFHTDAGCAGQPPLRCALEGQQEVKSLRSESTTTAAPTDDDVAFYSAESDSDSPDLLPADQLKGSAGDRLRANFDATEPTVAVAPASNVAPVIAIIARSRHPVLLVDSTRENEPSQPTLQERLDKRKNLVSVETAESEIRIATHLDRAKKKCRKVISVAQAANERLKSAKVEEEIRNASPVGADLARAEEVHSGDKMREVATANHAARKPAEDSANPEATTI